MSRILRITGLAGLVAVAIINTACSDAALNGVDDTAAGTCSGGADFVEASAASMTITRLQVDNQPVQATFSSSSVFGGEPSACFDAATNTASLIIQVGNKSYGTITFGSGVEGQIDLDGSAGTLIIDLHGDDTPVIFGKNQFTTGSWFVNSLTPLDVDVQGDANANGRFLSITMAASVTP